MIKIRALRPTELEQVLSLLARYHEQESEYALLQNMQQLYVPLHRLSQLLPLNYQFMPAIFVAVSQRKVLGMIWISRDGAQPRRWKIDHLVLDPDSFSYDVGTQLIHYVINRYGGDGVQTFLAYVDQYYNTGLELLKSCGFRRCGRLHYLTHPEPARLLDATAPIALDGLRESSNMDCKKLSGLFGDTLPPEARLCLEKHWRDFYRPLNHSVSDKLKGLFFKRWVAEDVARDQLTAAIELATANYQDFYVNLLINPGWEHLYPDAVKLAVQQARLMSTQAKLHVACLEFHKGHLTFLEDSGFTHHLTSEILVKDYWIPIEDRGDRLQSPILLFSGRPSPAINCR